jgi:thioesterase domain-containing protein
MTWSLVEPELRRRGHPSTVPALEETSGPAPYWRRHAEAFARAIERARIRHPIVLTGHSGAGPLLPAVAAALRRPVAGYLFVDAGLPRDGATRLDLLAAEIPAAAAQLRELLASGQRYPGWQDEDLRASIPDPELRRRMLAELRPRPADFWTEPIPVFAGWPDAPCAYIRLSAGYDASAARARERGWPVCSLEADHFHMLVDPTAVTEPLVGLAEQLTSALA